MEKYYKYSKSSVICNYFGTIGISIIGMVLIGLYVVGVPKTANDWEILMLAYSPFLLMLISIIIWTITTLKIRINLTDIGLKYTSLFKTVEIAWADITSIQKKYFYSGGEPSYGPPIDLEIKTKDNKKLKIFYFITPCEPQGFDLTRPRDEVIKEFETEIKKHIKIEF